MEDGSTHVSFSDVVRAHYAWDRQNGEHSREAYDDKIRRFERDEGEIIDAYWCRKDASAVALTRKRVMRGRFALTQGPCIPPARPRCRVHRSTSYRSDRRCSG